MTTVLPMLGPAKEIRVWEKTVSFPTWHNCGVLLNVTVSKLIAIVSWLSAYQEVTSEKSKIHNHGEFIIIVF